MFLAELKYIVRDDKNYKNLMDRVLSRHSVDAAGLYGGLKPLVLSLICDVVPGPVLALVPEHETAEALAVTLGGIMGEPEAVFFPGGEEDKESPVILNPHRVGQQMQAVRGLVTGSVRCIVAPPSGAAMRLPDPEALRSSIVRLYPGLRMEMKALVEMLMDSGYVRESLVERPGEIAVRGGILDIYPYSGEAPCRMEFFGDEIETMRTFDAAGQTSTGRVESLELVSSPVAWTDRDRTLLDFLGPKGIVFCEDPELVLAEVKKLHGRNEDVVDEADLRKSLDDLCVITHHTLSEPRGVIDLGGRALPPLGRTIQEIRETIASLCNVHRTVILLCDGEDRIGRVEEFLELDEAPIPRLRLEAGSVGGGFVLPSAGLLLVTEGDLFGRTRRRRRRDLDKRGVPIRELSALKKGDFVVHVDYGIGEYLGLQKIEVQGAERECLAIRYAEDDRVYVPVDKMIRVQKYMGSEGRQPTLSRLGSGKWERIKAKTKRSIQDIAEGLIKLYSARKALPGHAFGPDTTWQKELEASFVYEETPDQTRSIEEVKLDMEDARPMDRLICGDVGYGKTEVAIRAAFKAVTDGKQVAVLVPTTVLAQQHFRSFQDRLSRFPVVVEMLSRFRSRKEQAVVVEGMRSGGVDVVIGTHRLLSKDVGFKDLGLLIVDEEHRFGVKHKERLKALKETVDVIALSATPIPRTLQFSLMGIRDTSIINTPPKDRLPIITEVVPFDEGVIAEALEHELARGGQVFFVHNRVRSIYAVARMIRRLVPGIRLAVAHGQMEEKQLEKVMLEFLEGMHDCLVSTMIIESGLDMPNVNTLIVHRADRLGLAQLYQLRGRVGRSEKRAYAYLLTPPLHVLTQDAVKRLRTIEELTELGSGFQIALRDLEIRGAGNLLGVKQSGYIDAVGFDLYTQLVEEAVAELKSGAGPEAEAEVSRECHVDAHVPAYLPVSYVEDENLRVNLYRDLWQLHGPADIDSYGKSMIDRFGPIPVEAANLLRIAEIRLMARELGFHRVIVKERTVWMYFDEAWMEGFESPELFSERLGSMVDSSPVSVRFLEEKAFGLRLAVDNEDALALTRKVLQRWA